MVRSKLCALTITTDRRSFPERGYSGRNGSLIRLRKQLYCCSLIYKLPVFRMPGTSARYSGLYTPVETGTPPYIRKALEYIHLGRI